MGAKRAEICNFQKDGTTRGRMRQSLKIAKGKGGGMIAEGKKKIVRLKNENEEKKRIKFLLSKFGLV